MGVKTGYHRPTIFTRTKYEDPRRGLRTLLVLGLLVVGVSFLPWQNRSVDISVTDPVPAGIPDEVELHRVIDEYENGEYAISGYEVHKATPFGDGILAAALGAIVVAIVIAQMVMRRSLALTISAASSLAVIILALAMYDALVWNPDNDWSSRDWYTGFGDSHVIVQTETTGWMIAFLVTAGVLAWRSFSMLRNSLNDPIKKAIRARTQPV